MKGVKRIEVHNHGATSFNRILFTREGVKRTYLSDSYINFMVEYLVKGEFLSNLEILRRKYVYHKPKQWEDKTDKLKNMYLLIEFYGKDDKSNFMEVYVYSDSSKDKVNYYYNGLLLSFPFDENPVDLGTHFHLMGEIISQIEN